MKAGIIASLVSALLVAAGTTYVVKPELFKGILPEKLEQNSNKAAKLVTIKNIGIIKANEWADCAAVRDKVAAEISKRIGSVTDESVAAFAQVPENRLLLAQWVIADAELRGLEGEKKAAEEREKQLKELTDKLAAIKKDTPEGAEIPAAMAWEITGLEKQIAKLEKAQKEAYVMSESAADKSGSELMELIGGDPEWAEQFAFSCECVRPGMALAILKKIATANADLISNRMVRDIATATALEYAKFNWNQEDAVERANFYIESWKDGRLYNVFDTMPFWHRRIVCGNKGDNMFGSVASLRWAQENMRVPIDKFSAACWRCSYLRNNIYGDIIHGSMYYAPFDTALGDNRLGATYIIGGICGSLSHFGAFSAVANGVPAMTAGEPGHCAFLVLVGDTWTPAYSLSWERDLHWQPFHGVGAYSSLHAATELYSDAQKKETQLSDAWRILGNIQASSGKIAEAAASYEKAATIQPRNWLVWRNWTDALAQCEAATPEQWLTLNNTVCTQLVQLYPELGFEIMQKGLLDNMAKALRDKPEELHKACLAFWQNVKSMGPDRWHIETLANKQLAAMGLSENTPDKLCAYYADVLSLLVADEKYGPTLLNWGNQLCEKLQQEDKAKMTNAMIGSLSKSADMALEERTKLLSPIILAAEKNRDLVSFQSLGKMIADMGHKNPEVSIPKFEPYPGKLASEGGLVWISSTSNYDKPYDHPNLLTPQGGSFHTENDTDAWVAVELPRQVNVTGVVLVTTPGNMHRHNDMKIQVSENGTDWTDVADLGPCTQRIMRSDLGGKLPVAKYVRILRSGGPEYFHLNGIYIYGNQAA